MVGRGQRYILEIGEKILVKIQNVSLTAYSKSFLYFLFVKPSFIHYFVNVNKSSISKACMTFELIS